MRLPFLLFLCVSLFLTSCGASKKKVINKKNPGVVIIEPEPIKLPSVNQDKIIDRLARKNPSLNEITLNYIRRYAPIAVKKMYEFKIPASITLAQGILESGRGISELALKSNNHFGIKCHTGWEGERVYHDDDESGECFRKYIYPETSYNDHSLFLTQRRRYAFLFDYNVMDYKSWAYGLQKAGYATDRKYPAKLLKIIDDFNLHEFDKIKEEEYLDQIKEINDGKSFENPVLIEKISKNHYDVKKGDTLYSISRAYNITVNLLKKLNDLADNTISIGQRLLVK